MSNTQQTVALDAAERAARDCGHDLIVKRTEDALLLSRRLSRGRWQPVGSVRVVSDGYGGYEVECSRTRIASTIDRIADAARGALGVER